MKRELTAVYTKATYFGEEQIEGNGRLIGESENSDYVVCIYEFGHDEFALAAVQPSTGEIVYDCFRDNLSRQELETRLSYLPPLEIIVITETNEISSHTSRAIKFSNSALKINHQVNDASQIDGLEDYHIINYPESIQRCLSSLINYFQEFNLENMFSIPDNFRPFKESRFMIIPAPTLQALEIFTNSSDNTKNGTLVSLLDHSRTLFGGRLFRKWISRPLIDLEEIKDRQQAIADLSSNFSHLVDSVSTFLTKVKHFDLEHMLMKVHYSSTSLQFNRISRKQVYLLLSHFDDLTKLIRQFEKSIESSTFKSKVLNNVFDELMEISKTQVIEELLMKINISFYDCKEGVEQKKAFFKRDTSELIEKEYENIAQVENSLDEELKKMQKELGNSKLRYVTVNNDSYLIEIRNDKKTKPPPSNYIKINATKSVGRYRTKEVSDLYKLKKYHEEMLIQKCDDEFQKFIQDINSKYAFFNKIVTSLSVFDCLLSLCATSSRNNYTSPQLSSDPMIKVTNARHPIIEQLRPNYVSNNINIEYNQNRVLIITGPNMGGKSSYVKMVALFTIMTQIGSYLPCDMAEMGIFDSIFIRMGASDNILKGTSTFMMEMMECRDIISRLTNRSLVILDEIGRGTGTVDGIALAYSILKYLIEVESKPLLLFITHYPSIHVLEHEHPGEVANYHMGYEEIHQSGEFPEIIFLYNLCKGVVNNSYGLNVAKLAGIPKEIISNAYKLSEELKLEVESNDCLKLIEVIRKVLKNELSIDTLYKYLS
ncbi:MSH3 DNA mismatch repair protein MSH3 [Candida maltosa Xu316]